MPSIDFCEYNPGPRKPDRWELRRIRAAQGFANYKKKQKP